MATSLIFGNKSIAEFFYDLVIKEKRVSIDEIYRLCDLAKIKRCTAERKLREKCENADIQPIKNLKGVVVGYEFKTNQGNFL